MISARRRGVVNVFRKASSVTLHHLKAWCRSYRPDFRVPIGSVHASDAHASHPSATIAKSRAHPHCSRPSRVKQTVINFAITGRVVPLPTRSGVHQHPSRNHGGKGESRSSVQVRAYVPVAWRCRTGDWGLSCTHMGPDSQPAWPSMHFSRRTPAPDANAISLPRRLDSSSACRSVS